MTTKILVSLLLIFGFQMALAAEDSHGGGHEDAHEASDAHAAPESHESEESTPVEESPNLKKYVMEDTGPDVKIPVKIWEEIQGTKAGVNISFVPIEIRFQEKTPGVLVDPEFKIIFPRGGGEIDLFRFVKEKQGTFRVFFNLAPFKGSKNFHVYYVSRAKKRKLDGEVWGAGCRKYMDVTSALLKGGIEVNTTRARHDSVLGGHFVIVADQQVTQVTFRDSSQSHLFCDDKVAEKKEEND